MIQFSTIKAINDFINLNKKQNNNQNNLYGLIRITTNFEVTIQVSNERNEVLGIYRDSHWKKTPDGFLSVDSTTKNIEPSHLEGMLRAWDKISFSEDLTMTRDMLESIIYNAYQKESTHTKDYKGRPLNDVSRLIHTKWCGLDKILNREFVYETKIFKSFYDIIEVKFNIHQGEPILHEGFLHTPLCITTTADFSPSNRQELVDRYTEALNLTVIEGNIAIK